MIDLTSIGYILLAAIAAYIILTLLINRFKP